MDLLYSALQYYGLQEIPGKEDNAQVVTWLKRLIHWAADDEIPWCAAFANGILKENNYFSIEDLPEQKRRPGTALARDFMKIPDPVIDPVPGDLAVFWRKSIDSYAGHVGFYIRQDAKNIWVLGGNQSNQVSIAPYAQHRLLSFIRPQKINKDVD